MARPISISTKGLKELQKAMKKFETAIEPKDVKPVLAYALMAIKDQAYTFLRALTKRAANLPPGWEHIEDALIVQEGKSDRVAMAFCKVFRRKAPQAIWIEFGHRMVGHKPGKKATGKFITANPFFRPAIDMQRKETRRRVNDGIKALLQIAAVQAGLQKDDAA
jgi:hypothetical protein